MRPPTDGAPGASPSERLGRLAAAALPPPRSDDGQRSFGAFLAASRERRRRRPLPLALAVAGHVALLAYGVLAAIWHVDEVKPPPLVISSFLPMRPPRAAPASPRREEPEHPPAKVPPRGTLEARLAMRLAIMAASKGGDDRRTDDDPTGPECGGFPPDDEASPPSPEVVTAPPAVATKQCLDCPSPHLPPAYRRLGLRQSILVRICADRQGRVVRTQVLRGIDAVADESVTATIAGWRYSPYMVNGNPVPFCYVSHFVFTTE